MKRYYICLRHFLIQLAKNIGFVGEWGGRGGRNLLHEIHQLYQFPAPQYGFTLGCRPTGEVKEDRVQILHIFMHMAAYIIS